MNEMKPLNLNAQVERLMDIANALDEWKNAGGDSLAVAGAIQTLSTARLIARMRKILLTGIAALFRQLAVK